MTYELIIIIASLCGIIVSSMVRENKRTGNHICPIDAAPMDCEAVTTSQHNKMFGVPLEIAGIAYYLLIGIYAISSLFINFASEIKAIVYLLTFSAFILSVYLIFVQVFKIRKWCFWCVGSAIATTFIFAASTLMIIGILPEISPVFAQYKILFLIMHLLGFALGLGGATFSDVFFFKFLKDFKISKSENNTLETFTQFIWIGLFLSWVSGLAFFLGNYTELMESSKFLLKVIVVCVVTINGAALTLFVSPHLTNIHFIGKLEALHLHRLRRIAFALGGISVTSWYGAFILGTIDSIPLPLSALVAIYALILTFAVSVSQVIEHALSHKNIESSTIRKKIKEGRGK